MICIFHSELKLCLKLDPDHKDCQPYHKKVRRIVNARSRIQEHLSKKDYSSCVEQADVILRTETDLIIYKQQASEHKCHCSVKVRSLLI